MATAAPATVATTGAGGTAWRTDPATLADHPDIVDDWTLRPTVGHPLFPTYREPNASLSLVVTRCPGGPQYALMVCHVDPEMAAAVRALGLPDEMATEVYFLSELEVETDHQAREAARHLARAVAGDVLPMAPVSPADVSLWRASVAVVSLIVRRTWPAGAG